MKSKLFVVALLMLTIVKVASAQNVTYKILEDDPDHIKPITLYLEPFYADMSMSNPQLGWDLRADAMLLKRFDIRAEYRKAYMDALYDVQNSSMLPMPKDGIKKTGMFELGGSLYFYAKTKSRNIRVTLSSSTYGNKRYTTYIMVPAHKRVMWGARGGIYQSANNFEISDKQKGDFWALNKANNKDSLRFGDYTATVDGYSVYKAKSVLNSSVVYAGITHRSITNLQIYADGYRRKGNQLVIDWYLDLLSAPIMSIKDINTATKTWEVETASGVKQRIGWRIGLNMRSSMHTFISMKAEFGSKPSLMLKDEVLGKYYLSMSMGVSIPMLMKSIQKWEDKKSAGFNPAPATN